MDSLSEQAIKKAVRSDAIQHPITILPLTLSVLATVYLVLYAPIVGGTFVALAVLLLSGAVAAGSFIWRYLLRYNDEYARKAQEVVDLIEQRSTAQEQAALQKLRETLEKQFKAEEMPNGTKALQELVYEYEQLLPLLDYRSDSESLRIAQIPGLAHEIYREGLNVLKNAFDLSMAIRSPSRETLENDVAELGAEIEQMRSAGESAERIRIKESTLDSTKERLMIVKRQQLRIDELFHGADRCEASLHRTRIELAAFKAGNTETSVSAVTEALRRTIDHAKEVQAELREMGF